MPGRVRAGDRFCEMQVAESSSSVAGVVPSNRARQAGEQRTGFGVTRRRDRKSRKKKSSQVGCAFERKKIPGKQARRLGRFFHVIVRLAAAAVVLLLLLLLLLLALRVKR